MRSATYQGAALAAVACAALAVGTGCRSLSNSGGMASAECAPGECAPGECHADGAAGPAFAGTSNRGTIVRPQIRGEGPHGNGSGAVCRDGSGNCPHGGCPNCEPPKRWSEEWYAQRSGDPVSARQVDHAGKQWPPYARPRGEKSEFSHIYHAAHYWPYPYVCDDRAYVRTVLALQEHNGWTEATTMYEYHFDADTQEVNQPGRLHMRWILQNPRPEYRVIHVQTAENAALTEARLAATRLAAIEQVGEADLPPILPRVTEPLGRPAREIDAIQRQIFETIPEPRIQYIAVPTGAGAGGN
ncbi:MAG: hypothetical protein WD066_14285 [Planctomycetaceae bacterium]